MRKRDRGEEEMILCTTHSSLTPYRTCLGGVYISKALKKYIFQVTVIFVAFEGVALESEIEELLLKLFYRFRKLPDINKVEEALCRVAIYVDERHERKDGYHSSVHALLYVLLDKERPERARAYDVPMRYKDDPDDRELVELFIEYLGYKGKITVDQLIEVCNK